jgi:O-antigen ligase
MLGNDIDCRVLESTCNAVPRASLYFAKKTKIGYYIGMLALVPACWFIIRRRFVAAVFTVLLAGAIAIAAGSRFAMITWLVGSSVLAFVAAAPLGRLRWVIALGVPVLFAVLAAILFQTSEAFQARVNMTAGLLAGSDYTTLNNALSGRLDIWVPLWTVIKSHWLVGVGPGDLDSAVRPFLQPGNAFIPLKVFHAHQVLLDIQAATGLVGLLAFLAFYGWAVLRFIRLSARGISLQWAWLLVFLLLWFPVNSHHGFYSSEMVLLTFFMLGLGLASPRATAAGEA